MFYILDENNQAVKANSTMEWAIWFEKNDNKRQINLTTLDSKTVISTVFLGIGSFALQEKANLFETMVFGGKMDLKVYKYSTYEQAVKGHDDVVGIVKIIEK